MSVLQCEGIGNFDAFSGHDNGRNNPAAVAIPDIGPLPPGRYYIVNRGSGGLFTHVRDLFVDLVNGTDHNKWFALFRDDGDIDDWTFIHAVGRGHFRLHASGLRNRSDGCITLPDRIAFDRLQHMLRSASVMSVPGGKGLAYGTVDVT
ncbi:DUF2778 domain-containing protein [Paraburkholderia azotifigens]|uniref:DUF2778 domain-containing protein n=1 Tax=Paraburkholderia azotifigens TaxID=2057004 RepID=A0A5C6VF93_9BURK|nr:DUF2778 domain-containing protein [Paraburkholderia azotifigens]TXC82485.1 DUF2778 domain-containing protein [Paraburkholderia azotifigens]